MKTKTKTLRRIYLLAAKRLLAGATSPGYPDRSGNTFACCAIDDATYLLKLPVGAACDAKSLMFQTFGEGRMHYIWDMNGRAREERILGLLLLRKRLEDEE